MGAHLVDQAYWALGLTQPVSVSASSSPWGGGAKNPASYPAGHAGGVRVPRRGRAAARARCSGSTVGSCHRARRTCPTTSRCHSATVAAACSSARAASSRTRPTATIRRVYPESRGRRGGGRAEHHRRASRAGHEHNWIAACKGEAEASSPFGYAAALNETMLLGMAALRTGQGKQVATTPPPCASPMTTRSARC